MSMRGIDTQVRKERREVFKEVASLAYYSENLKDDMEALPSGRRNYNLREVAG